MHDITPIDILNAYCNGYFPMARTATSGAEDMHWYDPPMRGIIPIAEFHCPRSLRRAVLKGGYEITINRDFAAVIDACAAMTDERKESWINPIIRNWFCELHRMGFAHSVEYREGGVLTGGLYGLAIGGAFFGESMFSRTTNASKIALVHLVARLHARGFTLLDSQFVNDHLVQFGCHDISRDDYLTCLYEAVRRQDTVFVTPQEAKVALHPSDAAAFLNRAGAQTEDQSPRSG